MEEDKIFDERKKKLFHYLQSNYNYIVYILLALIVFIAVKIRSSNLSGLRDVTTGGWTLGPDLDPFLFLRWAKHIIANGSLMVIDSFRYVPLGFNTKGELILLSYMIAWFHKLASVFGSISIEQSAAIFPVFMFAFTVVAFFLLARKIFVDSLGELNANIIALISSFFLSVVPSLLPRTIAGIPEKESAAFFFLFLTFYLFLSAWKAKNQIARYSLAILSGLSTAAMALVWGGYIYIFVTLELATIISFVLGRVDRDKFYTYSAWLFSSFIFMIPFSTRYTALNLAQSTVTGAALGVFLILLIHLLIFNTKLKEYFSSEYLQKIPQPIISIIITIVIGIILSSAVFGINFIPNKIADITHNLVRPVTDRLGVTVAENRQPYFGEWANSFGPDIKGIPIMFWLFFIGSVYLFNFMVKTFNKKERIVMTSSYLFFLFAIIFSRYSSTSILNGENALSLFVYTLGFIVLLTSIGFFYYKHHKNKEENKFQNIDFGLIFIFSFFFFGIISARGSVRTIMMLVPSISIIISYFVVSSFNEAKHLKDDLMKIVAWTLVAIIILSTVFAGYQFYNASSQIAKGYVPSVYTQQWQKAMSWVRENTDQNAVFGHWWDYGYWVQSIGERATVLDGGNVFPYWNYLMGRHALTGSDNLAALDFLYAHNTTHFLIDSTDIGKYGAFSSIGSDENYDRASFIPTFARNNQQMQEKKNSTIYLYEGGVGLDEDIIYTINDTRVFLPAGKAGLGGIIVEKDKSGNIITSPMGLFVYQNKRYDIPLRYAFDGKFIDFGSGIESGIFLVPRLSAASGEIGIEDDGALLYLSNRTVKSQLARLYLYNEDNSNFKLAHTEDDFIISQIKAQDNNFNDEFIVYDGLRGPIKIWEINYPSDIQLKSEYLQIDYPNINLLLK